MIEIIRASAEHVRRVAPLFDAYRRFYDQPADLELATAYIQARLERGESVIFLAADKAGGTLGFTQLYPSFCSVAARPIFVLYDLFVRADARRGGVATALMKTAQEYAEHAGAAYLSLETATTNTAGQRLYEKLGWRRDDEFQTYIFDLPAQPDAT